MDNNVLRFLAGNHIEFAENDTHCITECIFCGKDNKLYINSETGMFDCKVCGSSGNFNKYQAQFLKTKNSRGPSELNITGSALQSYIQRLKSHTVAQHYLYSDRKLAPQIVEQYRLGVSERGDIIIPHFYAGKPVGLKYRYMGDDPEKPKYYMAKGSKPVIYNGEILATHPQSVVLVEGEFDLLAGRTYGIKNIIAVPGAQFRKFDWSIFEGVESIYLCYDQDSAGQKGAYDLASRLKDGLTKCKNVVLPENDLNECLKKGIPFEKIKTCIEGANFFDVSGIVKSIAFDDQVVKELLNPDALLGYPTGHVQFDRMTGGLAEQQLTVLSGVSSAGKTTFATHLMYHYARQNIPVALFCLESPVKKVLKDLVKMRSGKDVHSLTEEEIKTHLTALTEMPLHWYDSRNVDGSLTIWKFKAMLKDIRDRYGVKFVVLDDMQFVLNTVRGKDAEASRITKLMFEFKELANSLNIHLIVVVHVNREGSKTGYIPKIFDLKGGSGIEQSADYVIFVHRDVSPDAPDEIKENVDIAIAKNRIEGNTGVIKFKYDIDKCSYEEI